MPTKVWQPGEEVTSADWNAMVQEQVVATFATAAERDAAITSPKVGQLCYVRDLATLLEYTDRSAVPGWHKPWNEPWGWVANYAVPDPHFGGEQWVIGGGYVFPTPRRAVQVRYTGWAIKDVDGVDAHVVLRMVGGVGGTAVLRDAVTTLHQGWAGYIEVSEIIPTDIYPEVHFRVWTSWGAASIAWSRVSIIDVGPQPVAPKP